MTYLPNLKFHYFCRRHFPRHSIMRRLLPWPTVKRAYCAVDWSDRVARNRRATSTIPRQTGGQMHRRWKWPDMRTEWRCTRERCTCMVAWTTSELCWIRWKCTGRRDGHWCHSQCRRVIWNELWPSQLLFHRFQFIRILWFAADAYFQSIPLP